MPSSAGNQDDDLYFVDIPPADSFRSIPRHPASTLFPYTTLFRSVLATVMHEADMPGVQVGAGERRGGHPVGAVGGDLESAVADVRGRENETVVVEIGRAQV